VLSLTARSQMVGTTYLVGLSTPCTHAARVAPQRSTYDILAQLMTSWSQRGRFRART
jgi:hypothetical protein